MRKYLHKILKQVFIHTFIHIYPYRDICSFSRSLYTNTPTDTQKERQKLLYTSVRTYLSGIYGSSFNLSDYHIIQGVHNIIDHHDILNDPIFFYPNMTANLHRIGNVKNAIITFTDSGISVSHNGNKRGIYTQSVWTRIFPHSKRNMCIFGADKITSLPIPHSYTDEGSTYKEQITAINRTLWKKLFAFEVPELFHIPGEVVVSYMLQKYLQDTSTVFYKILCTPKRDDVLHTYNTLRGCWDKDTNHGTHFFWGIDDKKRSVRLWIENGILTNTTAHIYIPLTPEHIIEALKKEQIYPGLFLVYSVLICHCGIVPLTGGRSTDDIFQITKRWSEDMPQGVPIHTMPKIPYAFDIIAQGGLSLSEVYIIEKKRRALELWQKIERVFLQQV